MRELPEGADLLDTARELMQSELLPALSGGQRHAARMIMRAMQIAARQLQAGDAPLREEAQSLAALLAQLDGAKGTGMVPAGAASESNLTAANQRLVELIREGQADPGAPHRHAMLDHLRLAARARLLESNPRVLDDADAVQRK